MQKTKNILRKVESYLKLQILFLIFVILFGAYVRVTGSGAGCGRHWPLCQGKIIPPSLFEKTLIELTHRLTSGLLFIFSFFILYIVERHLKSYKLLLKFVRLSFFFLVLEALLGAGLVLLEHVANNSSHYRALSMSLHLINTYMLIGTSFIALLLSQKNYSQKNFLWHKQLSFKIFTGVILFILLSISGAITALGDTLFPVTSHYEAIKTSFDFKKHLFINLRIYHPFLAIFISTYLFFMLRQAAKKLCHVETSVKIASVLIGLQVLMGWLNLELLAPALMQLIHLFLAELLWLSLVAFCFQAHLSQLREKLRFT